MIHFIEKDLPKKLPNLHYGSITRKNLSTHPFYYINSFEIVQIYIRYKSLHSQRINRQYNNFDKYYTFFLRNIVHY